MIGFLPKFALFAHRGASSAAPENTLAAFRLALLQQADGIELDVHLSSDRQVVVIHDDDLGRTTDGDGRVRESSLVELKKLDAGKGETIPTLEEVLDLVKDRLVINIELKGFSRAVGELVQRSTEIVRNYGLQETVIYSSFDPRALIRARRYVPHAKLGLLLPPGRFSFSARALFRPMVRPWSLHPHYSRVNEEFISRARQTGHLVLPYTVNHPGDVRRMIEVGANGIFTDDVPAAAAIREVYA